MWIASSTELPGGAGPSATSSGVMCCASASAGASSRANRRSSRFSIRGSATALCSACKIGSLFQVRTKPAFRLLQRHAAPRRIILQLVTADLRDAEIVAVAMAEVEAGHGRGREHREILGQRDLAGIAAEHLEQVGL